MERKYKYDAFISYRHISPDKEIADRLQKKLESYRPPKSLLKGQKFGGWHLFRDETELPISSNLGNDITDALENSEFLIVICSKTTGQSRWCMQEIEYFKQLHNGSNRNIITVVADGNPEDVFPPALCNELVPVTDEDGNTTYQNRIIEPLAANVSGHSLKESLKKLDTEFLRAAAPLLGCGYDNLYNRERRKRIRRLLAIGCTALSALLLFTVYTSIMLWRINAQKTELAKANAVNLGIISENLWATGDGIGAIETALSALPSADNPDQPAVPSVMRTLAKEIGAYSRENFSPTAKLTCKDHVEQLGYAGNGSSVVARDSKSIYFWDSKTGALKKEYPLEAFGDSTATTTIHFDDTGLYESRGLYKYAVGVYVRNAFNYLEGYKREKAADVSLSATDVLLETSSGLYKLDGTTGEELWRIDLELGSFANITETNVIVSAAIYQDGAKTGTSLTIFDRTTGAVLSELTLADSEHWSSHEVCVGTDKVFFYQNLASDTEVFSFDISGNQLVNKAVLYSSDTDPLSTEYNTTSLNAVQLVGDTLYIVKTHWDLMEYQFLREIIAFDSKSARQLWRSSYKCDSAHGHMRLAAFEQESCGNFCNLLAVAGGSSVNLFRAETGAHIVTYELDSTIKTSCYSKDGSLTVITADGFEVFIPIRNIESKQAIEASPTMAQSHKFLSQHMLYASFGHGYAVSNENSNEIFLYSDTENADFNELFTNQTGISKIYVNRPQTHLAINMILDKRISIYDLNSGAAVDLITSDDYFSATAFISDYLFAAVTSDRIEIFDVRTGTSIFTKEAPSDTRFRVGDFPAAEGALIFSEDFDQLSVVTEDGTVSSWTPKEKENDYVSGIEEIYANESSKKLLLWARHAADPASVLELYDINTQAITKLDVDLALSSEEELRVRCVTWSNENTVLVQLSDETICCFDLDTGACRYRFRPDTPQVLDLICLNDRKTIGVLCNDSILYKVRTADGTVVNQVDLSNNNIKSSTITNRTKSLLVPRHNLLILSGWDSAYGLSGGYAVDLDSFQLLYTIDGYEAYYEREDAFLVVDHSVLGSFPLYSVEQLVEKAKQSIMAG